MKKILILSNRDITLLFIRMELIESFIKQGYEVYVSFPRTDKVNEFQKIGCQYIETKTNIKRRKITPIKDIELLSEYKKMIRTLKPDVVLTYTVKPNIYGGIAAKITNTPYIANITGLGILERKGMLKRVGICLHKNALNKANCVFCQNEENEILLKKYNIGKDVLKRIPGSGVNIEKFKPMPYPNDETIRFLFIGRILKQKGIEEYIQMAKCIKVKYPNTEFDVLGACEDEKYKDILEKEHKGGVINYHGLQYDIRPFLEKSHGVIHPTYHPEGMSNVLLESLACARPIITTNRSGCKEIVEDQVNGYVVKQQDIQDLIQKVEHFIQLPNETKKLMGERGRQKVETEFNRNIVVQAYLEEIEKIESFK